MCGFTCSLIIVVYTRSVAGAGRQGAYRAQVQSEENELD